MFSSPLLPLPAGLEIATIETVDDLLVVHVGSTKVKVCCPLCFCLAKRRHSRSTRVVADLPCAGFRVQLRLQMRKFFCENADGSRRIFTERVPAFIEPWAQTTVRLRQAVQAVGTATCGELGTRLATRLGIGTSAPTILRRIMALPSGPEDTVSHLGLDDFALRRGKNYGTVLVDLQRHQVIDLLPDRQAETAKAWLRTHPEIKLVSRDRAGDYATAAREASPPSDSDRRSISPREKSSRSGRKSTGPLSCRATTRPAGERCGKSRGSRRASAVPCDLRWAALLGSSNGAV